MAEVGNTHQKARSKTHHLSVVPPVTQTSPAIAGPSSHEGRSPRPLASSSTKASKAAQRDENRQAKKLDKLCARSGRAKQAPAQVHPEGPAAEIRGGLEVAQSEVASLHPLESMSLDNPNLTISDRHLGGSVPLRGSRDFGSYYRSCPCSGDCRPG